MAAMSPLQRARCMEIVGRMNDLSAVLLILLCIWALLRADIAPRWNSTDSAQVEVITRGFGMGCLVSGTAAVFEAAHVLTYRKHVGSGKASAEFTITGFEDSQLMLLVYCVLVITYYYMFSTGDALVHTDLLAFGGARPVYTIRYLEWAVNVPVLMITACYETREQAETPVLYEEISNGEAEQPQSWLQQQLQTILGFPSLIYNAGKHMPLAASARLTVVYIGASWLSLVVDDHPARWLLIWASFTAYGMTCVEQILQFYVLAQKNVQSISKWLLATQVVLFGWYGVIFMLACFGLLSAQAEQSLYTWSDMVAKVVHSIVIVSARCQEDVLETLRLRDCAISAAADLQRMISQANVPIFCVNCKLEVEDWNLKIAELTGVTKEDALHKRLPDLVVVGQGTSWRIAAESILQDALSGKDIEAPAEIHFRRPHAVDEKKSHVTVAVSATPRRNGKGEVRGAVCVGQDVTELTAQRQEAQHMAASLSRLIDTANAPIFEVDMDCRVTEWNKWLVQNSGWPKAGVLGERLATVVCPSHKKTVLDAIGQALKNIETDVFDFNLITADGTKGATLLINATPRLNRNGEIDGAMCVGQDISKLKDLDDWKSSMMAMVSHELKSPLHGIIGLSHALLEDVSTTSNLKKPLAMVNNSAKRLLDMVSNMMDASVLVQEKRTRMTKDPVQLASIIEEVVLLCQQAVDKRGVPTIRPGVTLVNGVTKPLPVIEADAYRCTQLMYNLVSNALKFTHQGSVTVSAIPDDIEQVVTIDVKDTGIGIAQENLARIFQPFDQEDTSESRRYEGLGLGLAISREVVVKHGGNLTVKSQQGVGSTFRAVLPYKMKDPALDDEEQDIMPRAATVLSATTAALRGQPRTLSDSRWTRQQSPQQASRVKSPFGTMASTKHCPAPVSPMTDSDDEPMHLRGLRLAARSNARKHSRSSPISSAKNLELQAQIPTEEAPLVILSVDDDVVNQQVMESLLASTCYQVKIAMDGSEGLNFIRQNPLPALILLDVMMPGLSGTNVLRTLRKTYGPEILPVIMVSAKSDRDTITRCLKFGANDFVQKPFGQAELHARIQLHIQLSTGYRRKEQSSRSSGCLPSLGEDSERGRKGKHSVSADLLKDLLPEDLLESLQEVSKPNALPLAHDILKSRAEQFLQRRVLWQDEQESSEAEAAVKQLQRELESAKVESRNLREKTQQLEKTTAEAQAKLQKYSSSWSNSLRQRATLFEKQAQRRYQQMHAQVQQRMQQLQTIQLCQNVAGRSLASADPNTDVMQQLEHAEDSLTLKEMLVNRIIEEVPEEYRQELQNTFLELRNQVRRLLVDSSRKEQLLMDAEFKLHLQAMTIQQKEIQLSLGLAN